MYVTEEMCIKETVLLQFEDGLENYKKKSGFSIEEMMKHMTTKPA